MNSFKFNMLLALLVICFLPLTIFALPVADALPAVVSGALDIAEKRTASALATRDVDPDGRLSCIKTGRPDECTIRVTQQKDTNIAVVNIYDPDCRGLQDINDPAWQAPGHAVLFSQLPYAILLDFNNDWTVHPTGEYAGHPIGQQWNVDNFQWPVCNGPWDDPHYTQTCCILPFTC